VHLDRAPPGRILCRMGGAGASGTRYPGFLPSSTRLTSSFHYSIYLQICTNCKASFYFRCLVALSNLSLQVNGIRDPVLSATTPYP
jgi:hypothetical protein